MVFDGKDLTSFETDLLAELHQAQSAGRTPIVDPSESGGAGNSDQRGAGRRRDRRIGAAVMAGFVAAIVIVAAVAVGARNPGGHHDRVAPPDHHRGPAEQVVIAALDQTNQANTLDFTYGLSETPAPTHSSSTGCDDVQQSSGAPLATVTRSCAGVVAHTAVAGAGTINVSPKAMSASANVGGNLDVTLTLHGDLVAEGGGAAYGSVSTPGQPLSGFADLVESSIGPRAGALAMTQMASPNAYFSLEKQAVTGATATGHSAVDGVAVTDYDVSIDVSQLLLVPGLTADEQTTMRTALAKLHTEGYHDSRVEVSIDAEGFVRRIDSVARFADGGTVTFDATYTDFGCAPIVPPFGSPPAPIVACTATPPTTPAPATSTPSSTTTTVPAITTPDAPPLTDPSTSSTSPPPTAPAPTSTTQASTTTDTTG
jgi:hypothetical protein